jgi:hypothetical protein
MMRLLGAAACVAVFVGCQVDDALGPSQNRAVVQFINANPGYDTTDFWVDSTDLLPAIEYGGGSSAYVATPKTERVFTVRATDDTATLASTSMLVIDQSVYAMIFTKRPAGNGLLVVPEASSAPPAGMIALRVVNVSPTAGAVDLYINSTASDTALATPVESNIPPEGISQYQNIAAGAARMRLTAAGTKNVLLDVDGSALVAGQVRTVVVIDGNGGGLPLTWLALRDRN